MMHTSPRGLYQIDVSGSPTFTLMQLTLHLAVRWGAIQRHTNTGSYSKSSVKKRGGGEPRKELT